MVRGSFQKVIEPRRLRSYLLSPVSTPRAAAGGIELHAVRRYGLTMVPAYSPYGNSLRVHIFPVKAVEWVPGGSRGVVALALGNDLPE
jgi:hypothetical protein